MKDQNEAMILVVVAVATFILIIFSFFSYFIFRLYSKKQLVFKNNIDNMKASHEQQILVAHLEIQEQTFQNISREIHDNIGQVLTLSKFQLNSINFEYLDKAKLQVESSIDLISEAISDLSDISRSLSSEAIYNFGLIRTLEAEIERVHNLGWLELSLIIIGETSFMKATDELIIFRIIQEALNNIVRHSKAKRVEVILQYQESGLEIRISDDGIGFNVSQSIIHREGSGLVNMEKRTGLLNGKCEILSETGEGTTIIISVPKTPNK